MTTDGRSVDLSFASTQFSEKLLQLAQRKEGLSKQHVKAMTTRNTLLQSHQDRLSAQCCICDSISMVEVSQRAPRCRFSRRRIFDDVSETTQMLVQLTIDTDSTQREESAVLQIVDELFSMLQDVVTTVPKATARYDIPSINAIDPADSPNHASVLKIPDFVAAFYAKDGDARSIHGRLVHLQLDHEDDLIVRRNVRESGHVNDPPTPLFEEHYQAQYDSIRQALDEAIAAVDASKKICQEQGWNVDMDVPKREKSRRRARAEHDHAGTEEQDTMTHQPTLSGNRWSMPEIRSKTGAALQRSYALDIESISALRETQDSPPPRAKSRSILQAWANEVTPDFALGDHLDPYVPDDWTPISSPIV